MDPTRLTRRRFLRGTAFGAAAGLLAACRLLPSGPDPTVQPSPTGEAASSNSSPTPTSTVSPSPSASPTRALTGTPTPPQIEPQSPVATEIAPTFTPTPPPTPFPPGPPTKLGILITRNDPRFLELVRTRNLAVISTLEHDPNLAREFKRLSPETLLTGRLHLPQLSLSHLEPLVEAQRFMETLMPIAGNQERMDLFDAWEGYNEPLPGSPDEMARLSDFEAERTRLMAANGLHSVVGNFPTGHPPLEWWPQFRSALKAVRDHQGYLGLHEYSAPIIHFNTTRDSLYPPVTAADEGWLTLRYRKAYRQHLIPMGLEVPLIITECGIDGLVENRPGPPGGGWQDFVEYWQEIGMGPDGYGNYIEQLAWYDEALHQDSYVVGACIYAAAASVGWESYEILGDDARILEQYLSVHPVR